MIEEEKVDPKKIPVYRKGIVPKDPSTIIDPSKELREKRKKSLETLSKLGFAYLGKSQLTCWHKPSLDDIYVLKDKLGITMIVSVMKE